MRDFCCSQFEVIGAVHGLKDIPYKKYPNSADAQSTGKNPFIARPTYSGMDKHTLDLLREAAKIRVEINSVDELRLRIVSSSLSVIRDGREIKFFADDQAMMRIPPEVDDIHTAIEMLYDFYKESIS